ncbi:MAG: RNA polymerase sigma factor [Myxococcota bacterium]|nr:sigma-70 family RNA polymerase sigma factor [Myxococcota bacterium]
MPTAHAALDALVAGLQARERWAAQDLHARMFERVRNLVWRLLGADQDHHDVVNQVFLNVLGAIGTLRDPAALEGWVLAITCNTVRREIRGRRYRRLLFKPFAAADEPVCEMRPGASELLRGFYAAAQRLATEERLVFLLHYVDGQTLAEVAQVCGCSLATAKRRLARARTSFMKRCKDYPGLRAAIGELRDEN